MLLGGVWVLSMIGVAVVIDPVVALAYGVSCLAMGLWSLIKFWWDFPLEVRVTSTVVEWKARFRQDVVPVASLRRLRCNTVPTTTVVLEFEGHQPRLMLVTGGFADFLEALAVVCPWVEVSAEIVERFGSWSGKTNGFFVESLDPLTGSG